MPEITHLDNQYLGKNIPCSLAKFLKLKLFLYNSDGYSGVIGNNFEVGSINIV